MKFGLAISPQSSIKRIIENVEYIDLALIMTVKPGFAGQDIITKCINKVKRLSKFFKENNIDLPIQVDGGIKLKNISLL
ncbi:ribulose-phosphate 3-epimerase, partial [bacterium]|nr:ribulose-phosphate 3-epimerase [bacterium]